jgi:hypothetical protein
MQEALSFIKEYIDSKAGLQPIDLKGKLSIATNSRFAFWELYLLGRNYLLTQPFEHVMIKRLISDFVEIENKTDKTPVFYSDSITQYMKQRLIAERIPFLLGDKQFFLPTVGMNIGLSKKFEKTVRQNFTPATQAVFLYLLYCNDSTVGHEQIIKGLGLSRISVSRAINELDNLHLLSISISGKTNKKQEIAVGDKKRFYSEGIQHFGKVIRNTLYFAGVPKVKLPKSGLSALSERTMLNPPAHPIYALHSRNKDILDGKQISVIDFVEQEDAYQVDLLAYNPVPLLQDSLVDAVTMIQSLNEHDERIESAVSEYMEKFTWY